MEYINGRPNSLIGDNSANNDVSTALVTANRDGSLLERVEWVITDLAGTADLQTSKDGPSTVETNAKVTFSVSLIDRERGSISGGDITPGTYEVFRAVGGAAWASIATGSSSTDTGLVYVDYTFATLTWDEEDNYKVVMAGISATLSTATVYVEDAIFTGRVSRETDIEDKVDEIPKETGSKTWNATALQSIQDESEDALEGENLDHLIKVSVDTSLDNTVATDSVLGYSLVISDMSSYDRTTDSQEAIANSLASSTASLSEGLSNIITIDSVVDATQGTLSGVASNVITIDGIVDAIQSTLSGIASNVISITGFATSASLSEVLAISTKQAGSIGVGSTIASWNAAEADVVSIGANDTKYKLHSLMLDMNELDTGATISIRMYSQINGTERKLYDEDYVVGTDPDGIWLVDGTVGIHEVLRVTAESSAATDDGASIGYDYILEGM